MNASRPEADTEYSSPGGAFRAPGALAALGAIALLAAEFCTLLSVRTVAAHPRVVHTVRAGPHHSWALVPIAVLAALLAVAASRPGRVRRPALAGIALLGLAALGVALGVDLPDVHATGLVGSPAHGLREGEAHAGPALYLETLGAVVLLVAAGAGALLSPRRLGASARRPVGSRPRSAS